jgi:hypothetical protein
MLDETQQCLFVMLRKHKEDKFENKKVNKSKSVIKKRDTGRRNQNLVDRDTVQYPQLAHQLTYQLNTTY